MHHTIASRLARGLNAPLSTAWVAMTHFFLDEDDDLDEDLDDDLAGAFDLDAAGLITAGRAFGRVGDGVAGLITAGRAFGRLGDDVAGFVPE